MSQLSQSQQYATFHSCRQEIRVHCLYPLADLKTISISSHSYHVCNKQIAASEKIKGISKSHQHILIDT
jgi:hypothetical protein